MSKIAHLEPLPDGSYLMRVGPEGWSFGQPYELLVGVVDLGDGRAEIRGLDKPISVAAWKAMADCGRLHGFRVAVFDRIRNGKKERREVSLNVPLTDADDRCFLTGRCCKAE